MANTPTASAAIKAWFLTGETPTQDQFDNFISSYANLIDGHLVAGNAIAIADVSPADISTATPLTVLNNVLGTTHNTIGGCLLLNAPNGRVQVVYNKGVYPSRLYAQSGETITNYNNATYYDIQPGEMCIFRSNSLQHWTLQVIPAQSYVKKRYVALITQTGIADPVATVLENSLGGAVVWSYQSTGVYLGTLAGAFVIGKVIPIVDNDEDASTAPLLRYTGDNYPDAMTLYATSFVGAPTNGIVGFVDITVYQ